MPIMRFQRRPAHLPRPVAGGVPHATARAPAPRHPMSSASAPGDGFLFSFRRAEFCVFDQVADYNLRALPDLASPVVLDLGANVGVWSLAAHHRWPSGRIHAYEPHPDTAALLRTNMLGLPVLVTEAAVDHPKTTERARLFAGKHASTECSLNDDVRWPHVSQQLDSWAEVAVLDAAELPEADVVKIDTEGRELPILRGYGRKLDRVRVLLVEPHAVGGDLAGEIDRINAVARGAGLFLLPDEGHGLLRYLRR